ncbi:TFC1 [Candida jiufengensis]|uniref:TFC1 n=1 Tax=Candida jiufengensis TaxID=497108 RepID=UPI00222503C3|nr:TFC1 [Candida jiufengensis]KAI5955146.1 TFC1 [Candida jiufengensis]
MDETPQEVPLYSMDIPHIAAVELPLRVKNEQKAIDALGGKNKISDSIKDSAIPIELKLRKDPFQHPIKAAYSANERVVLKIQIKKDIVKQNPTKSIQELLQLNEVKPKIQPVAIIDKTYRFRAMSDFQISTKHNKMLQDLKKNVLDATNYQTVKDYVADHNYFNNKSDLNNEYFENRDHMLPPPPLFSHINYPYNYKYQKNPVTAVVKDEKSGDLKVVSKKSSIKLHTILIPYETEPPKQPPSLLTKNYEELIKNHPPRGSHDDILIRCIEWVKEIFEIKPIWLRRQLVDIIPEEFKRHLKLALPYVTYLYRSGPWRFCNIKIGIDPRLDSKYWIYQTEYFRVIGRKSEENENSKKIIPKTLEDLKYKISISQHEFFDGVNLPSAITFQIGDIIDMDITSVITNHKQNMGNDFLKDAPDVYSGWVNKQTMDLIRKIMRYKLNCLVNEQPIDQNKIYKFTTLNFNKEDTTEKENEELEDEPIDDTVINNEIGDGDEEIEEDVDDELTNVNEEDVIAIIKKLNPENYQQLSHLVGFIKQDNLDLD